jgi:hypothetical protein
MFQWDESINSIDVPAGDVVHLFRSMRDVQLALPGISAQQASAYLCQYKQPEGIATVAAFHLHKRGLLAYYFSDPRVVPEQTMDDMLDQGLNFVESMGFLLTDQDIHLLAEADQQMLWESLPLKAGLVVEEASQETVQEKQPEAIVAKKPAVSETGPDAIAAKEKAVVKKTASSKSTSIKPSADEPVQELEPEAPEENGMSEKVDDLLAAVEAMRAKRPGLRARKTAPSAEEMLQRKAQLRETIGRILATL